MFLEAFCCWWSQNQVESTSELVHASFSLRINIIHQLEFWNCQLNRIILVGYHNFCILHNVREASPNIQHLLANFLIKFLLIQKKSPSISIKLDSCHKPEGSSSSPEQPNHLWAARRCQAGLWSDNLLKNQRHRASHTLVMILIEILIRNESTKKSQVFV